MTLSEMFLTRMLAYGPLMLALGLWLGAIGVPVPTSLLVLAGGAFIQQGVLEWKSAASLGLLSVVIGDSLSYAMGRLATTWVQRRFGATATWQAAQTSLDKRGRLAVYLTRFLLTPLAIPLNLIAGSSGYRFSRFLFSDIAGEITWLILYGGLGYLFGSQWEELSQFLGGISGALAGVALLAVGLYVLHSQTRQRQAKSRSMDSIR